MRVAIIGSRTLSTERDQTAAYALLLENVPTGVTEIISGGAEGVDRLAERYAREHGLALRVFPPDYLRYGKTAPLRRNDEIIACAQYVLALWDGLSHGTAYTVAVCVRDGVPVKVIPLRFFEE